MSTMPMVSSWAPQQTMFALGLQKCVTAACDPQHSPTPSRRPVWTAPREVNIDNSSVLPIIDRSPMLWLNPWSLFGGASGVAESWTAGVSENWTVFERERVRPDIRCGTVCGRGNVSMRGDSEFSGGGAGGDGG